jgi:beta-phosphoglucomutase-like phosphatase (HAD superfamily)
MAKKKLTPKMLAFCDCIALEGKNLSQSYRDAYSAEKMSAAAIHTEASLLASNPAITKRIETLRERKVRSLVCSSVSDAEFVLTKLREWVECPADSNRIRAAELLGKACGIFQPSEIVVVDRSPQEIEEELRQRLDQALSAESLTDVSQLEDDSPDDDADVAVDSSLH